MTSARHRLEPGERLQPPLEDHDLLVAVHALDPEHGFGVELAVAQVTLAGRGHQRAVLAAALLHVAQSLLEQR